VNPNARAVAGVRTVTATIEDGAVAKLPRLFFYMIKDFPVIARGIKINA
jgi:hypothetical protein